MERNLQKAQVGTVLERVNTLFLSGESLDDSFLSKKEKGEKILGELSGYEKAILVASNVLMEEHNEKVDSMEMQQIKKNKEDYNLLSKLLWNSIESRHQEPDCMGIRKGFKVVETEETELDFENFLNFLFR